MLPALSAASTFTVNSTGDPGASLCDSFSCSLRAAMNDANASSGTDTISFDIPGSAPHTIQPTSALPEITDPITLDGTTQPGFAGAPVVELDGTLAGAGASGLEIAPAGGGSTVRALVVNRFAMHGIVLGSGTTGLGSDDNLIAGSYIGTDVSAMIDLGNALDGVSVAPNSANNRIGGTTAADRNVISGNDGSGVVVDGASAGLEVTGNSIHSNTELGIDLEASSGSGASGDGVSANDAGDGDAGGNDLQNFPLLSSVQSGGGQTTVQGTLDTQTSTSAYRLEFFSSPTCDPSGNGEGGTYLGSEDLVVDSSPKSFMFTGASEVPAGHHVTATATAPGSSTSEFSACAQATSSPTVTNPGDQTNAEGDTVSLQVQASAPGGATLSYSATGLPPGLAIDSQSGLISGDLGFGSAGTHPVLVAVSDGGASDQASFDWTVTNTNRPPTADDQSVTTEADTSGVITLTATDPDGGSLVYTVVADPAHGDLTGAAPDLTYTPAPGYRGPDSFTFRASDGTADSNVATVTIDVDDTTPPDTAITAGPSGSSGSTDATFSFTSTETNSTFECKLDSGSFTSCTSPETYTELPQGPHTFSVRAVDLAGNSDQSEAIRTWTIDPGTSGESAPGFESNQTDGTVPSSEDFGWSASQRSPLWVQVPATDTCGPPDGPDNPIRAFSFKNANPTDNRRVQLNWPMGTLDPPNRRLIGPTLHGAQREQNLPASENRTCEQNSVYNGQHQANNWRDFDDNEWLTSPYYVPDNTTTPNSGKVYALMHQEFRSGPAGTDNPACETAPGEEISAPTHCWFGSITSAYSDSGLLHTQPSDSTGFHPNYSCYWRRSDPAPGRWEPPATTPNEIGACYSRVSSPDPWPPPDGSPLLEPSDDYSPQPTPKPNQIAPPEDRAKHIVGTIPYEYYSRWGRHGYKTLSNVIRAEGDRPRAGYFVLAGVSAPPYDTAGVPTTQEEGVCLLWTDDLSDPSSWKAWDGQEFAFHPRDYDSVGSIPFSGLDCEPVLPKTHPWSLSYNTYLQKYMLVSAHAGDASSANAGVYYRLSDDLINWSDEQLIVDMPNRSQALPRCRDSFTYPTVIDPHDPAGHWPNAPSDPTNPNFDHPGATPDLYANYTDIHAGANGTCTATPVGTLGRMGIDFKNQRQANLNFGLDHPKYGYDYSANLVEGCNGGTYDAQPGPGGCATAWRYAGAAGVVTANWDEGDDVWYGSAFYLPAGFETANAGTHIMRWLDAGQRYGGIATVGNGSVGPGFRLVRGTSSSETALGAEFSLPSGRWVWLEVHQRLGKSTAYSEVFVDGTLVAESSAPNMPSDAGKITSLVVGFTDGRSWSAPLMGLGIDRTTILGAQRGTPTAPPTPQGFRQTGLAAGVSTFEWNTQPDVDGYRVWKRENDAWTPTNVATPPYVDVGSSCGTAYRISSYKTVGGHEEESNVSSAIEPC